MLHYYKNTQKLNFTTFLNKICRELRKIRETDWFSCKNHETKKKKSLKLFWVGGLLSGKAENMQSVNFGDQNWFAQWIKQKKISSFPMGSEYKTRGGEKS